MYGAEVNIHKERKKFWEEINASFLSYDTDPVEDETIKRGGHRHMDHKPQKLGGDTQTDGQTQMDTQTAR
jgi:hypothetical protein